MLFYLGSPWDLLSLIDIVILLIAFLVFSESSLLNTFVETIFGALTNILNYLRVSFSCGNLTYPSNSDLFFLYFGLFPCSVNLTMTNLFS